jgi:hypothetical protein
MRLVDITVTCLDKSAMARLSAVVRRNASDWMPSAIPTP